MVIKIKKFGICCDRCRREAKKLDGVYLYDTYGEAINNLPENWLKVGRKFYCPNCQRYNENSDSYEPIEEEEDTL